jgi:UMF1 family MFS transporter
VLLTLLWWIAGVVGIFFLEGMSEGLGVRPETAFFGIALVTGSAIGATQSSSRAVVGLLAPAGRSAQMFGFWGTSSRVAYLLAMAYGPLSDLIGSMRWALFLVIAFFVAGGVLLLRTPIEEGIAEAAREEEKGAETGTAP